MKFTYLSTIVCLFLTSTVMAEMDYFIAPGPNKHYKVGETASFVVEDMPDEDDQNVNANLHRPDGSFVKTIDTFSSRRVEESGEEFPFEWLVDVEESGEYYIEIRVGSNRDDATQSYPFTVEVDGEAPVQSDVADTDAQTPTDPETSPNGHETQEQPDEPEETEQEPAKNKLSLHNKQSKVAHISSHNDIDTVSDPSADNDSSKPTQEVKHKTSSKLADIATSVTSKLPLGHKDTVGPANLDISKLAVGSPKPKTEPLMPQTKPHATMKELAAADEIAIEQEKKWIAEQKKRPVSKDTPSKKKPAPSKAKQPSSSSHHRQPAKGKQQQPKKVHQAKPKVESKKVSEGVKKPSSLTDQIKAKTKETLDKVKQQAQEADQREKDHSKLTLAQQEALDDAAAKKELESIKKSQAAGKSKEKRSAYRQVMRNRAKFSKQNL